MEEAEGSLSFPGNGGKWKKRTRQLTECCNRRNFNIPKGNFIPKKKKKIP